MDKYKENGILLVCDEGVKFYEEVDDVKKEVELYNDIYKEIFELVGLDLCLNLESSKVKHLTA